MRGITAFLDPIVRHAQQTLARQNRSAADGHVGSQCNRRSTSAIGWMAGRVRIFILTVLLAIELAVAQFSPTPVPHAAVHQHHPFVVQPFAVLRSAAFVLAEHRLQALLQVVTDLILVTPGRARDRGHGTVR